MKKISIILMVFLIIQMPEAFAAINGQGILDDVQNQFKIAASGWASTLTARASWLFWMLALISMVWTHGMLLFRKADIADFYGEFIRFIVFTGFFWWLLTNGPTMAIDVIDSMQTLGDTASGISGTTPSGIVDVGFMIFNTVVQQSSIASPVMSTAGLIMATIVITILALIAANMLILLVSAWILAYAGVFYLGFGGSRWTSDIAITYFKTVLNIGVQLMTMVLLVGIGQQFINAYYAQMDANMNLNDMAAMLVAAIVLLVLVNKIPPMLGHIAQGGGTHALAGGYGAGSAIAAAGVAGAAAAMAGSTAAAGAANIAGGAQAVMAAAKQASQNSSSASDLVSRMGGALDSNTASASTSASTSSPLAAAMGDSLASHNLSSSSSGTANQGSKSSSTAAHLASGIKQVMGEKMQSRINQTVGGQVASAINQSTETQAHNNKATNQTFDNNSLSGETTDIGDSRANEIAAFRDG
ncbi:P-type conjugative transfer protein TrbL [Methylobacter svalbardensis]|uniref:P-type conjugative transfer protein TrbL n=1 Tax=Methylobacter svalbardensis TaxID=3080016 RepID=UPI0030EE8E6E